MDLLNSHSDLTILQAIFEEKLDALKHILYYTLRVWKQRTPVCRVHTVFKSDFFPFVECKAKSAVMLRRRVFSSTRDKRQKTKKPSKSLVIKTF